MFGRGLFGGFDLSLGKKNCFDVWSFFLWVSLDGEKLKGAGESVLGEEMRRIPKRGESLCGDSLLFFFFSLVVILHHVWILVEKKENL